MRFITIIFLAFVFNQTVIGQAGKLPSSVWKKGAGTLRFWDSDFGHAGADGYIDTFSIGKNHFRLVHHDTLYDGIVEKLENRKWILNIELPVLGNHNDYYFNTDVNNDGYPDFVFLWKWTNEIFLFNPQTKKFRSKSFAFTDDWELLDTARGIYCNWYEAKFLHDYKSQLYVFKNNKPHILYYIKFEVEGDEIEQEVFRKMTIMKSSGDGKDKIMKVINTNTDDFEYGSFWKKYYKMLLDIDR